MNYIQYLYYGMLTLCIIYFVLYVTSIIRNFADLLGIKVLTIDPPPSEKDIETPLDDVNQTGSIEQSNPNGESKLEGSKPQNNEQVRKKKTKSNKKPVSDSKETPEKLYI